MFVVPFGICRRVLPWWAASRQIEFQTESLLGRGIFEDKRWFGPSTQLRASIFEYKQWFGPSTSYERDDWMEIRRAAAALSEFVRRPRCMGLSPDLKPCK